MKRSHLAYVIAAALSLGACTQEPENTTVAPPNIQQNGVSTDTKPNELACNDELVLDNVRNTFKNRVQEFATELSQGSKDIDPDKLIAAAQLLEVKIKSIEAQNNVCVAQFSLTVPKHVLSRAEKYAPVIKGLQPMDKQIHSVIDNDPQARFDGSTVVLPIEYHARYEMGELKVYQTNQMLADLMSRVANGLLPYGLKDTLVVNGANVALDNVLANIKNPQAVAASVSENDEVPTISEASAPSVSPEKFQAAQKAHQQADRDIKNTWRNIDSSIQKTLLDEQKTWESKKHKTCLNKTKDDNDDALNQYLYMRCDTQMTRERIKYLNGYSLAAPQTQAQNNQNVQNNQTEAAPTAPKPSVAPEKYQAARQAHQQADRDIKQAWRKIDPSIQQSLVEEQKTWESKKRQTCLGKTNDANDDTLNAYIHMKCDTELTHERIKYLNGYSIQ